MLNQTIKEQIQEQMKVAMRAQQKERLAILRLILAAFKQIEIDERITLDQARELVVLQKMQKQRLDSIQQFKAAGRDDLVAKEQYEMEVIQSFRPQELSEEELNNLVSEAISHTQAATLNDLGKVIAFLKPQVQGRVDMAKISARVKALLG